MIGATIEAQGPARLSFRLIPGTFFAELRTYEPVGHGLLSGLDQDVLPTGNLSLASFDVKLGTPTPTVRRNISVHEVRLNTPKSVEAVIFKGAGDSFSWALTPKAGAPALIYGGCQTALRGSAEGPTTEGMGVVFQAPIGEVCVPCE